MDNNHVMGRWERQEGQRRLNEEDANIIDVIVDVVHDLHEEVHELGAQEPPQRGGSSRGKKANIARRKGEAHERLMKDYFVNDPIYNARMFRQRFRMSRRLFLKLVEAVENHDRYFVQKADATGSLGFSSVKKCTAMMRMLNYGIASDATNEYVCMASSTSMEALKLFVKAIQALYESTYLRQLTKEDIENQLRINEARGWPGMFASLDCMHYEWKNCPIAWQGSFQGKDGNNSIILEAIADKSLWIWHAYFGLRGSNNDINVIHRSPLVSNFLRGESQGMSFEVNGHQYPQYYLLTDGIYPKWSIFIQSIHDPQGEKRQHFAKTQEATRKDVERCFRVLQARWAIIQNPSRQWDLGTINDILMACVIMRNMIIEDERDQDLEPLNPSMDMPPLRRGLTFEDFLRQSASIHDENKHYTLRNDLIEHLWALKGSS